MTCKRQIETMCVCKTVTLEFHIAVFELYGSAFSEAENSLILSKLQYFIVANEKQINKIVSLVGGSPCAAVQWHTLTMPKSRPGYIKLSMYSQNSRPV